MAAADVESNLLADSFFKCFADGGKFTTKLEVPVPVEPQPSTTGPQHKPNEETKEFKEFFVLNSTSFVNLQIYVQTALKLPRTKEQFVSVYPDKLFKKYTDKDKHTPALYEAMKETLVAVSSHSYDFQNNTLSTMITLGMLYAGYISNYAATATKEAKALEELLPIILDDTDKYDETKVKAAVDQAAGIVFDLSDVARKTSEKCLAVKKEFSKFKTDTELDKTALVEVFERMNKVFPTPEDMTQEAGDLAAKFQKQLIKIKKNQEKANKRAEASSGVKWYHFIPPPIIGISIAISDIKSYVDASKEESILRSQYDALLAEAGDELALTLAMNGKITQFTILLSVSHKILQIQLEPCPMTDEKFLEQFSMLATNLDDLGNSLDAFQTNVKRPSPVRRKRALDHMREAAIKWEVISDTARVFQRNGLVMRFEIDQFEKTSGGDIKLPPRLQILAAEWGGEDITNGARIQFYDGKNFHIRTVDSGLKDTWRGKEKSLSMLLSYGDSFRVFACRENSGSHTIAPGSVSKIDDDCLYHEVSPAIPKPEGSKVDILAIIYGGAEVRDAAVWQYCYDRAGNSSEPIKWSNENFGGDPWPEVGKSGCIFYTVTGGRTVRMLCGREFNDTVWEVYT
ncbi:hypothetical protein BJ508DRAFT_243285 [Ascobolus immersus RN42]|uniref:Uncharacterized protein n=1 Tax=Ascobolus immersus RN42 TaxID=1160509 RepID=A0A3N4HNI2_ASCIM|nr:hypothetical protein BJ508DRAFT_243285 [Ascobolus immersus RN42]